MFKKNNKVSEHNFTTYKNKRLRLTIKGIKLANPMKWGSDNGSMNDIKPLFGLAKKFDKKLSQSQ